MTRTFLILVASIGAILAVHALMTYVGLYL